MAKVLLVTGGTTHNAYTNTKAALESKGHTVTVSLDTQAALDAASLTGVNAIVAVRVTSSSTTTYLHTWLRDRWSAGYPILLGGSEFPVSGTNHTSEHLGICADARTYANTDTVSSLAKNMRVVGSHKITAGFTDGSQVAVLSGDNYTTLHFTLGAPYGTTQHGDVFAGTTDYGISLLSVEAGAAINGSASAAPGAVAPARAAFCGWLYAGQSDYTANGKTLIDQIIRWLADVTLRATLSTDGALVASLDVISRLATAQSASASVTARLHVTHRLRAGLGASGHLDAGEPPPQVHVPEMQFSGEGTLQVDGYDLVEHLSGSAEFSGDGVLTATGVRINRFELVLDILDRTLLRAPTAAVVVVTEARPRTSVDFYLDGQYIWSADTDYDGNLQPVSLNIPERFGTPGTHVLRAEQSHSRGSSDSEEFTLLHAPLSFPANVGPDAQAVDVPDAVRPNGTRAWVLQDLLPEVAGGIGSYVMPYNPISMTNPHLERRHTVHPTTVPVRPRGQGGKFHVMEGGTVPHEWTLQGYCPSKEMQDKLLAFRNLNRRFYIIDHRRRAWKVHLTNIEFTARTQQVFAPAGKPSYPTDWGHDYVAHAVVLDQTPVEPA